MPLGRTGRYSTVNHLKTLHVRFRGDSGHYGGPATEPNLNVPASSATTVRRQPKPQVCPNDRLPPSHVHCVGRMEHPRRYYLRCSASAHCCLTPSAAVL